MIIPTTLHAKRLKYPLRDELLVTLARDLFDDVAEQNVAGVRIAKLRARLKIERLLFHQLHRRGYGRGQPHATKEVGELCVVRNARRMGEQMMNRDVAPSSRTILYILG